MVIDIKNAVLIRAPVERVFEAISTSEGYDRWFTAGSIIEDGRVALRWGQFGADGLDARDGGEIVENAPPHRFSFVWYPAGPDHPTTVSLSCEAMGEWTKLSVTESSFDPAVPGQLGAALEVASGWGEALMLLKYHLEAPGSFTHPSTWRAEAERSRAAAALKGASGAA